MKKFLFASVTLVLLSACRNDSNDTEASIVGTWKENRSVVYNGKDNSVLSTESPDQCDKNNTYVFSADGKLTSTLYYSSNGTCQIDNADTTTYSYDAAKKLLTTADGSGEVKKLTNTDLHIIVEKYDDNNDGIDDIIVLELTRVK